MKIKNCQNCHDLKALKKELQQSYANFKAMALNRSECESNLTNRIEELEKEVEYYQNCNSKKSEELYRLQCANESLTNQLTSRPGAATVNRYKEDMISAVTEKVKYAQIAATARRKEVEAENKVKELEKEIVRLQERLEDAWSRECFCNEA